MKLRTIFFDSKKVDKQMELDEIHNSLIEQEELLKNISIDDIVLYLDEVSSYLAKSKSKTSLLTNLRNFLKKDNVEQMLFDSLLGDKYFLDDFKKRNGKYFKANPKGVVVQWLAGNVPLLGIFSVVQAILSKNVTIVKAPSKDYEEFLNILELFLKVSVENLSGEDFLKNIVVVLIDSSERKKHNALSKIADARIAWGGKSAVESILSYEKKWSCEDLIYGPKYSFAVIGKESLKGDISKLTNALAVDVSIFDQFACASPHTVFVEDGGKISSLEFAKSLAKSMKFVNRLLLPKTNTQQDSISVQKVRTEYEFDSDVFKSNNADWTVIHDKSQGLSQACFNRIIFVKPIKDIFEVEKHLKDNIQTIGLEIENFERKKLFCDRISKKGVNRFPRFGTMVDFEKPWDGFFAITKLVNWSVFHK